MASGVWKFYTQMFSNPRLHEKVLSVKMQQTTDCNKISSIDASFIFTSSALTGLLKLAITEHQTIYLFYARSVFV